MNRRLFVFVIILMGISLAGIILLQLFWIRNAIDIREEHFDKTVNVALRETAEMLEEQENLFILSNKIEEYAKPSVNFTVFGDKEGIIRQMYTPDSSSTSSHSYTIESGNDSDYVLEVWNEMIPEHPEQLIEYKYEVDIDSIKQHITHLKAEVQLDSLSHVFTHEVVYVEEEADSIIMGPDDGYLVIRRAQNLNEAFIKIAYEIEHSPISIEERTNKSRLEGALLVSLFQNGILIPIEFGIMSIDTVTSFPIVSNGFIEDDIDMKFTVRIFPNELSNESNFLVLQFPGRNMHLLKSMAWILAGSLLLTLIILATFGITLYMILRQKKLSDIKSDFINNMTHEFKTPIATISLAVDSIDSPKIIDKEKEIRYYTNIIREENHRMNNHVESVLRMSLLDKHDLEFNLIEVDVHELIEKAISKIKLLLDERNGSIMVDVLAENSVCKIDPDHFTNALLNLLDNAIKYSEDSPKIEIQTLDTKKGLSISITDQGMGMSKDIQHKIFDKFFRKSSGNIHNIKGFGLGLSYVKAVVDAMGGSISVSSDAGKGSSFKIVLNTLN